MRSNNSRQTPGSPGHASGSSEDFGTRQEPDTSASMQRLNQVIQNFHTKAALIILSSRAELTPAYSSKSNEKRVNKWFNIEVDETDDYLDDVRLWKRIDIQLQRPPPLVIETYLTTDPFSQSQRLVIIDDDEKRWDVYNALEPRRSSRPTNRNPEQSREILLERWTIALGDTNQPIPADLASVLPHVYKKSIVVFRALYTYCNFLPAWKLIRKLGRSRSTMGMKVNYRIVNGDTLDSIPRADNLTTPLYESSIPVTTEYSFGSTGSPAGPFSVQVQYRSNAEFRMDDSEELLSSRFIGTDDEILQPQTSTQGVGSLPNDQRRHLLERPELGHAYGSLSTYHQAGISPGTSPISALRAQRDLGSDPSPSAPQHALPTRPTATSSTTRRSSFSLQPFKGPTLAASPLASSPLSASPRVSSRAVPTLGSLEEEPTQNYRSHVGRAPSGENTILSSTSSLPKRMPAQRFQSSFGHRKNRLSIDRPNSKQDDDQTSSGKASAASSAQPGSGLMVEPVKGDSSGSIQADDENISDFLKLLEQKKDLLSTATNAAAESSARRTQAALSRFHKMRESNAALSDSMSSSLIVPRTSPGPSRPTSLGTSTSPGTKAVSPHTPHMPFAPSRLSAAYSHDDPTLHEELVAAGAVSPDEQSVGALTTDGAINIPGGSPQYTKSGYKRSISAQRRRLDSEDDIGDLYGMKSASMGANVGQRSDLRPFDTKPGGKYIDSAEVPISDSESARSSVPIHRYRQSRHAARDQTSPTQGSLSSIGGTGGSVERTGHSGSQSDSWGRARPGSRLTKPESKPDEDDEFPFMMDQSTITKREA